MPGIGRFEETLTFTLTSAAMAGGGKYTMSYELAGSFSGVFAGVVQPITGGALTDSATIALPAATANFFTFSAATNGAREFQVPTGGNIGQQVMIYLTNASGGNLTSTTFHTDIIQGTVTYPATGASRLYVLTKISATVWALTSQSTVDLT